jgi:hemerythrin
MSQIAWTPSLSVNHDDMDEQHRSLFALAGKLWDLSYQTDIPAPEAAAAIDALIDYTRTHFAKEERLLERSGYPALSEHRMTHASIFSAVDRMVSRMHGMDRRLMMRELAEFVSEWMIRHIQADDTRYAPYLSENVARLF